MSGAEVPQGPNGEQDIGSKEFKQWPAVQA
jgi:hypothetical protein